MPKLQRTDQHIFLCLLFVLLCGFDGAADEAWWTSGIVEEKRSIAEGLAYERTLYTTADEQPVRSHVLSVDNLNTAWELDVMGSFGVLIPPTVFADQSNATAVVNGGFFSFQNHEGIGLIAYNNRVLYSPAGKERYRGTLGITPHGILIGQLDPVDIRQYQIQTEKSNWNSAYSSLAAGPILVQDATNYLQIRNQGFNRTQLAPRTGIGRIAQDEILLVVVDGRQPGWSRGITLNELAELFLSFGAEQALNLDGGGSSIMVIDGEIVNRPSDHAEPGKAGRERPVANAIGVFEK